VRVGSVTLVDRRPVPEPAATALSEATTHLAAARETWEQAIRDALTAGGSLREVAALAGVSHGTIEAIARR